jgi:RHS repeat-associated protein
MTNNAGQTTRYELDVLNRTKAMTYSNGDRENYRFSHCSVLEEWTRGDQVITYDHDHLDRIIALHSPATQDELSWTFDPVGRVKTMRESSGITTEYEYTPNDLLASAMRSDSRGIRYFYDEGDRLRRTEDQDNDGTDYHYNERNEIVAVDHDQRTVNYRYDLVGRAIGSTLPNGVECQRNYDERNRLVYLNYQRGSDPLLTFKYGHNQLGQRIVEEKTSPEQCKLSRFCYNLRRELTRSDRRIGNGCNMVTQYRYDLNHNRIGRDQFTYENNNADQLTAYTGPGGAANLAYNALGQATDVGGFTFSYNQDQQIKEASGPQGESKYFYDGSGRRVAKEVNGEREDYLSLGSEVLKTYQNGELKARYFLGLGREGILTDGQWKYYLKDGLGSTVALTDESGNSVAAYDYSDYGETTQIAGDTELYNPYLYTGQEWDAELGMYNLRARHYSPTLGRFIARDPIGYGGGSNLYSYCNADPIDFVDPSGLDFRVDPQLSAAANRLHETSENARNIIDRFVRDKNILVIVRATPNFLSKTGNPGLTHSPESDFVNYCNNNGHPILASKILYVDIDLSIKTVQANDHTYTLVTDFILGHELGHAYEWKYNIEEMVAADKTGDQQRLERGPTRWENAIRSDYHVGPRPY